MALLGVLTLTEFFVFGVVFVVVLRWSEVVVLVLVVVVVASPHGSVLGGSFL